MIGKRFSTVLRPDVRTKIKRYKLDSTITNTIAYNLTRALYGRKIRLPIETWVRIVYRYACFFHETPRQLLIFAHGRHADYLGCV